MAEPHPSALARHLQPCQNDTLLTFAELHARAGKHTAYPAPVVESHVCLVCGVPLDGLATYCSPEHQRLAVKRSFAAFAHHSDIVPYND